MLVSLAQLGSAFIAPALAGLGVAAIAVPIAIHLLSRLRRKREHWGAMRFLRLAYQKQKNRLRLEQWLLLATRCLLVALIGLALAGPVLSGAWASWLGGGDAGRTVHVVVDNSLSASNAPAVEERARAWVEAAGASDRVVVWGTRRGEGGPLAVSEPGQSRAAMWSVAPGLGLGAADWESVVSAISADLTDRDRLGSNDVVAVVSPFARGGGGLEEPAASGVGDVGGASGALRRLGDVASVVLERPMASRGNVQVVSVVPRRSAVVVESGGGEVSATVTVRRFGDTAESATAEVKVDLLALEAVPDAWTTEANDTSRAAGHGGIGFLRGGRHAVGPALATATRSLRFGVGQDRANVVVPLRWADGALDEQADAVDLGLMAWLVDEQGVPAAAPGGALAVDAVPMDDRSFGLVRVLRRLRIGVQGGDASADGSGLGPGVFVRSALLAGLDERAVEFVQLRAEDTAAWSAALSADADKLDAVFVLSPSRLGGGGGAWSALSGWVASGGLLWVSPDTAELRNGSGGWASAMTMGLSTQSSMAALTDADATATPRVGDAAPEALSLLSGEWDALLGPVRVSAWRGVRLGADAQTWIALEGSAGSAASVSPLPWLVSERLGLGTVVMLGSALDPAWTNLPAKPLFPALMQEALRDVLSSRMPERTFAWDARPGGPGSPSAGSGDDGTLVALNVEADAGDTTALTEAALSAWWDDAVGPWSFVPDASAGGVSAVLSRGAPSLPLGRTLLWAVLVLVLLESLLSRRFSHATTARPGAGSRVLGLVRSWRGSAAA